ncbi:ABC transporter permease [Novosphingobium taihuense]|uniref:Peptide/nickel transport system permease protein n=1 Tax=Novosphingobium taihuense TaxID=260085 RepID=A0A7W7A7P5_9SPHN|nr:ABC transporter permease [Novosphingobium taihuense]MBB4611964.1 peptide/nickel transport system permease protein [Novosphingobium taihuense]TWH88683.1 peptide/nickel transport system permease protein [Novosphingobium taihuense]
MSGSAPHSAMFGVLPLIGKRFASALITLLLVSAVVFTISGLLPGDAAQETLGQSATPEQVAALRHEMGLDRPALTRYFAWLGGIVQGDPGQSLVANLPVREVIAERLPNSLMLAAFTALVSVPLALAIGIASAISRGGRLDRTLNVLTLTAVAVPEFLVATLGVLIFSVKLLWLPSIALVSEDASLWDTVRSCALPVLSLSVVVIAQMARMTRAAVADQLDRPYVEMARLKGVPFRRVVLFHVMPNAVGPIVNAVALSLSYLLGGAIIVETIFNFPGLASLMVNAVTSRDMPLLQACAMIFCAIYLMLVLVADVVAILANPRLRAQ